MTASLSKRIPARPPYSRGSKNSIVTHSGGLFIYISSTERSSGNHDPDTQPGYWLRLSEGMAYEVISSGSHRIAARTIVVNGDNDNVYLCTTTQTTPVSLGGDSHGIRVGLAGLSSWLNGGTSDGGGGGAIYIDSTGVSLVNSSANHIELTHDDLPDPPVEGTRIVFVPSNDNTGAVQIRIGTDDYTLQKSNEPNSGAGAMASGDIEGQHPFEMTYSGTGFWWTGGVVGSASRSNATGGSDGHSPVLSSGDAFPTSPSPVENDLHFFFADVASGLDWKDTDGTTDITSADNGDVARFNGTDWVKLGNRRGPAGGEGPEGPVGTGIITGFTELRAPATLSVADTWTATGATIPAADGDEWVRMNGNFDGEVPENFEFLSARLLTLAEHTVGGTTSTGDVERLQFHDGSVFQRILMARTSANEIILRHESAAQSLGNLSIYSYSSIAGDGAITLTPQTAADKNFNQTTQLGSGQNNRLFDTDITLPTGIGDNELFFIRASSNVGENTIAMTKARLETLVAVTPVTFVSTGTTGVAADRTPGATRNAFSFALGNNRGLLLGISNETPFRLQWGCTHTTVSINLQIVTVAASANAGEGGQESPGNEGVAEQTPDLVTVVLYQWFDDVVDPIP